MGLARPNTSDSALLSRLHAGAVLTIWLDNAKGEAPEALEYEANGELEPENAEKALAGSILAGTAGLGGVIGRAGGVSGSLGDRLTWEGCGVEQRVASTPFSSGCEEVSGSAGGVGWRGRDQTRVSVNGRQPYPSNGRNILFDSVIVTLGRGALILHRLFWLSKSDNLFIRGWRHNDFPFLEELYHDK